METPFSSYLARLGSRFGFELPDSSPGKSMEFLADLISSGSQPGLGDAVVARGHNGRKQVLAEINSSGDGPISDYASLVADNLFALLCKSMLGRGEGEANVPVLHHWVPNSYLKHFSQEDRPWNCRIHLRRTIFPATPNQAAIHGYVNRNYFRHGKMEGRGFYDDVAEIFFGNVECRYINAINSIGKSTGTGKLRVQDRRALRRKREDMTKRHTLAILSMFVIQSVRATVAELTERARTLADVVDAMLESLDSLGTIDATLAVLPESEGVPSLVFSPNVDLNRPALSVGDQRVHYFPVTPNAALLLADRGGKLDQLLAGAEPSDAVLEFNAGLIESAMTGGGSLYGAHLPWTGETVEQQCLCSSFKGDSKGGLTDDVQVS